MLLHSQSISRRLSRYVLLFTGGLLLVIIILIGIFCRPVITMATTEVAEKEVDLLAASDLYRL